MIVGPERHQGRRHPLGHGAGSAGESRRPQRRRHAAARFCQGRHPSPARGSIRICSSATACFATGSQRPSRPMPACRWSRASSPSSAAASGRSAPPSVGEATARPRTNDGTRRRDEGPLGIICGGGSIPPAVAARGQRGAAVRVVLFPLRGIVDRDAVEAYPHHWIAVGQFGRFLPPARAPRAAATSFSSVGLVRPSLRQVRLDWATLVAMPRIIRAFRGGDDHLLTGIGRIFEADGFRLLGAHEVAPDITAPSGALGRHQPDAEARSRDIARGFALLAAMSPFDVGQAAVVGKGPCARDRSGGGHRRDAPPHGRALREDGRIQAPARHRRAGQGAEATPGPPFRPALDRAATPCASASRAGLAGIAVVAGGYHRSPSRSASSRPPTSNGVFVVGSRPTAR